MISMTTGGSAIFHPFALFVLVILLGGVALFVVMSIQLWKLFCAGDACGGGTRLRDDRESGPAFE
ncbi:hypothetical protein ACBR40_43600 [Nonomuraea sp. AD125B]|uniref:hypothetical protein n=1 Tax=Nonomuraea sp. AD125B TaxID=3242897 RepID=UPI0035271FEA